MAGQDALITRIDAYLDGVPRSVTTVEEIGPFSLFINTGNGWRYYARPTLGAEAFSTDDVEAVLDRQRALRQPLEFEWIVDRTPQVRTATAGAGLEVSEMPLMHLARGDVRTVTPDDPEIEIRVFTPEDDLAAATAVASIGFGAPGTAVGEAGIEALPAAAAALSSTTLEFAAERMRDGFTALVVASVDGVPVASGSHQPYEGATEITGVACLPAYRRRGLGAAVTSRLVQDALDRDVDTVFLSAGSEDIARVYERVGFRTIGHVGAAAFPA
jgi:ribosomal protein S18 acetylase RimI-like enzyme